METVTCKCSGKYNAGSVVQSCGHMLVYYVPCIPAKRVRQLILWHPAPPTTAHTAHIQNLWTPSSPLPCWLDKPKLWGRALEMLGLPGLAQRACVVGSRSDIHVYLTLTWAGTGMQDAEKLSSSSGGERRVDNPLPKQTSDAWLRSSGGGPPKTLPGQSSLPVVLAIFDLGI